jgi:MoaA/NifB/PqqE/SkfB family radical SAM enzyme
MCFEKLRKQEPELEVQAWCSIVDDIKNFRPRIHLSGGEPFLYEEIRNLIRYIKKSGLFLTITTNGTFLNDYAEDIVALRVNRIHVSIDGPQAVHDRMRGVPGTFESIMNGLNKIRHLKKESALPIVRINSMLSFEDEKSLRKVVEIGRDIRAESIQFLHPFFLEAKNLSAHRALLHEYLQRDLNYWQAADITCTKPKDIDVTYAILTELKRKTGIEIFPSFNRAQLEAYYRHADSFSAVFRGRCKAMWNTATILSSGDVESCPDYVVGNCLKEKFQVLWNNETMKKLRRRIRNREFFEVCRACCFFYQ